MPLHCMSVRKSSLLINLALPLNINIYISVNLLANSPKLRTKDSLDIMAVVSEDEMKVTSGSSTLSDNPQGEL